jgi:hypothetical protein
MDGFGFRSGDGSGALFIHRGPRLLDARTVGEQIPPISHQLSVQVSVSFCGILPDTAEKRP